MLAVRSSTGKPVVTRCSEILAQRLGMIPIAAPVDQLPGRHQLVLMVTCSRPFPLLGRTYLWPAQPGLEAA